MLDVEMKDYQGTYLWNILVESGTPSTVFNSCFETIMLLETMGDDTVQASLEAEIINSNLDSEMIASSIVNMLKDLVNNVLATIGIGVSPEARLMVSTNILLSLYIIGNTETALTMGIVETLSNTENDNTANLATMVGIHTPMGMTEVFENIMYVTDSFISDIVTKLTSDQTTYSDAETGTDDEFKYMIDIINTDNIMPSTILVRSLMSGAETSNSFQDYLREFSIMSENLPVGKELLAANAATLLYYCVDTKEDMRGNYITYIEDMLLEDHDTKLVATITELFDGYMYKLKQLG